MKRSGRYSISGRFWKETKARPVRAGDITPYEINGWKNLPYIAWPYRDYSILGITPKLHFHWLLHVSSETNRSRPISVTGTWVEGTKLGEIKWLS